MKEIVNYIETFYTNLRLTAVNEIFTRVGLIELAFLLIILLASFFLARFVKRGLNLLVTKYNKFQIIFQHLNYFLFPLFFFIMASIGRVALQKIGWNDLLFNIFVTYFAVRIINRILIIFFKDVFWLQPARVVIWILAILNVFSLLDETILLLDSISFSYGDSHISLLTIFKALISILLALWVAGKLAHLIQVNISKSEKINPSLKILLNKTFRIIIIIIAVLITLDYIGIKLTAFAVLGGAIGVGIGFGLQKIVSNFICGFFLLMDKSIKPGDVIEIDNTFGTIQSLSGRYITVLTIEGKEHLIPNEDLITQKVVNWSHSNRFIRLSVDVGVSYDTDIPLALQLLEESLEGIQRIYKFRSPLALLTGFGNSSIDLRIVFWIKDPELGTENVKSQVRIAIWKKFQENKIQIPFPQNDVYIKSMPGSMSAPLTDAQPD